MVATDQEQDVTTRAIRIIDAMDDRQIVQKIAGEATAAWVYRFRAGAQSVEGISIDGVQEVIRRLATSGEVIRELECILEYEDDQEARFKAKCARYLVNASGEEMLMDTTVRGKRQPKYMRLTDGSAKFDEHWYEKGMAKAVRNAAEALIPQAAKDRIFEDAATEGRVQQAPTRGRAQTQGRAPQQRVSDGQQRAPQARQSAGDKVSAVLRALNEAKGAWDEGSYVAFIASARGAYPDAFQPNGNAAPSRLAPERLDAFHAWIDREVYGSGPDDPEATAPATGATDIPDDGVVDGEWSGEDAPE